MLFYITLKFMSREKEFSKPNDKIPKTKINVTDPKGITTNIGGGFNYLNIIKLTNNIDELPELTSGTTKFKSIADENFIDLRPFNKENSIFPFVVQNPRQLSRIHLIPGYIDSMDSPCEKNYLSKSRDQVLGNMCKTHPLNNRSDENDEKLKSIGYDIKSYPMLWTPISKTRKEFNRTIKESDYARFLFHCESFKFDHDDKRISFKSESNNGVHFWYKDSSNLPSAVRPLILSDFIYKYSRYATVADPTKWYSFTSYPFQKAVSSGIVKKVVELLSNKIISVEHRRINITSSPDSKNCPILGHYLKNGWRLSSDESPMETIFKEIDEKLNVGYSNNGYVDNGYYTEDLYSQLEYLNGEISAERRLLSVQITKTSIIDLTETGIEDLDGVYVPNLDIVIGKMKIKKNGEIKYPVDYIHHPNSKEGFLVNDSSRENIEVLYVDNDEVRHRPLYINTHGLVYKVHPTKNHLLNNGIHILRKQGGVVKEVVEVKEETRMRYGIFNSLEDARLYTQVNSEFMKEVDAAYKHMLHDVKTNGAIELEKIKMENARAQFERASTLEEVNFQIKKLEQETKIKELVGKAKLLEREIEKHMMTSVPGAISGTIKNILELGVNIVKTIQTFK